MTLAEIIARWNKTDEIVYKTPEIKYKSLEQAKTRVISKEQ